MIHHGIASGFLRRTPKVQRSPGATELSKRVKSYVGQGSWEQAVEEEEEEEKEEEEEEEEDWQGSVPDSQAPLA